MRSADPSHSEPEAKVLADIVEYGVHIVHVGHDAEDEGGPVYSYTVGLWHSFEQPEVIVFGLPEEVAAELLDAVTDEVAEGERFLAGTRHEGLLQDYAVRFLGLADAVRDEHLARALWAYAGEPFAAVQLVYPDKQGRWPWHEQTKLGFRECQPVIGEREA